MEANQPTVEAVAVRGDRIVYTGSAAGAEGLRGSNTRRMDLKGATMLPGLTDAHGHLLSLGRSLAQLNLKGTKSPEEIRKLVIAKQKSTPPGTWISGRGWDQNDWAVADFPTWQDLSGTEANPVILRRVDGHAAWLNRTALDSCGITHDTPDPSGGRILREAEGVPTGVLIDNAAELAAKHVPGPSRAEKLQWMEAAIQECHHVGLTGIHDAGVDASTLELYRQWRSEGKLTLRVYGMLSDEDSAFLATRLQAGPEISDPFLTIRAIKLYADGALGSRGAALLEPYSDDPNNRGLLVNQSEYLERMTCEALKAGFQVCTHAIGDRGNRDEVHDVIIKVRISHREEAFF
jgi:predicted amidohydrolase YtcJ